jgi:hypothetical protein
MNQECDHTPYLTDQYGRPCGSWVDEQVGNRVRVVCGVCGKFYGYRRTNHDRYPADRRRDR